MIYIEVNENSEVTYKHNMPFDKVYGLGKTKEELEAEGFLIDSIANPEPVQGKTPILTFDKDTEKLSYKYIDAPISEEDKVAQLEQKVAEQQQAILELTMMLAGPNA